MRTEVHMMTEREAADLLAVSVFTLRSWRSQRRGPVYRRVGGAIRYDFADLMAFLDEGSVRPIR